MKEKRIEEITLKNSIKYILWCVLAFCFAFFTIYEDYPELYNTEIIIISGLIGLFAIFALLFRSYELAYIYKKDIVGYGKLKSILFALPVVMGCFIASLPFMYIIKLLMDRFYPV